MISLQRSMHSSQIYTPGPAMSFFTCFCDLPQKEHLSRSPPSPIRATYDLPALTAGPDARLALRPAPVAASDGRPWPLPRRYLVTAPDPTPHEGVSCFPARSGRSIVVVRPNPS